MADIEIIHRTREKNYTVIDLTCVKDRRLSWGAKGLFLYLKSVAEIPNWKLSYKNLLKVSKNGNRSLNSRIKELKEYGYLTIQDIRGEKGQIVRWQWIIDETPHVQNAHLDKNPEMRYPHVHYPYMDNAKGSSKDISSKDISNELFPSATSEVNSKDRISRDEKIKKKKGNVEKKLFNRLRNGIYRDDLFSIYDNQFKNLTLEEIVENATHNAIKSIYVNNDTYLREEFSSDINNIDHLEIAKKVKEKFPYSKLPKGNKKKRKFLVAVVSNLTAETLTQILQQGEI